MIIPRITITYLYFNRCIKCRKRVGATARKHAVFCDKCYEEVKKTASAKFPKATSKRSYDRNTYQKIRKEVIHIAGHCALCGSKKNLTTHHIGGQSNIGLTCLCDRCHRMYEQHKEDDDII